MFTCNSMTYLILYLLYIHDYKMFTREFFYLKTYFIIYNNEQ